MGQVVADLLARVRLLPAEQGGRTGPAGPSRLSCSLVFEGEEFGCKLTFDGLLQPGAECEAGVALLRPELVKPRLREGSTFELREGGVIGTGVVLRIL